MFDQTFVDGAQQTKKPYAVFLSTLAQITAICALILGSILYTRALPDAQLKSLLIVPAPPAAVKPMARARTRAVAAARLFETTRLVAPPAIPNTIQRVVDAPEAPDTVTTGDATDQPGLANSLLFAPNGPASPPLLTAPKRAQQCANAAVRMGGSVAEANLVHRVEPIYPALAIAARVEGDVEFTAVISKAGRVEQLRLLRGHPLLVNAARSAILQWQYHPTMLNGQPAEVMTTITVKFRLGR